MTANSRRTQPYRAQAGRQQGATLAAMLTGAPAYLPNPQDVQRATTLMAAARSQRRQAAGPSTGVQQILALLRSFAV